MRFYIVVSALVSHAAVACAPQQAGPKAEGAQAGAPETPDPSAAACAELSDAVRPAVDAARTKAKTTDVAVGLITRDCPFVSIVSGPSDIAADARFRIASITKTYTSAVVLHFVGEGGVGLDDAIAKFELGIPNDTNITIRQLLNHTSGLFDYTTDPGFRTNPQWTPEERLKAATSHEPYFEPGKSWHYSNTNFIALGLIAQKLGSAPIHTLVRTLVLEPNGFEGTYFSGAEEPSGVLAPSFNRAGAPTDPEAPGSVAWADGAIVASLGDVTRWMRRYASGEATPTLKEELLAAVPAPNATVRYGLALEVLSAAVSGGNGASYGHGGDIPGYHSASFYFPEREWTITAIVNDDRGSPNEVMIAVMDALARAKK